jgi:hypothetical protein
MIPISRLSNGIAVTLVGSLVGVTADDWCGSVVEVTEGGLDELGWKGVGKGPDEWCCVIIKAVNLE